MIQPKHPADPAASGRPFMDEGDIGSGEKTPGQQETEEMIRQIPPLQPGSERDNSKRNDEGQAKQ
jgi:hypothetical protein